MTSSRSGGWKNAAYKREKYSNNNNIIFKENNFSKKANKVLFAIINYHTIISSLPVLNCAGEKIIILFYYIS